MGARVEERDCVGISAREINVGGILTGLRIFVGSSEPRKRIEMRRGFGE